MRLAYKCDPARLETPPHSSGKPPSAWLGLHTTRGVWKKKDNNNEIKEAKIIFSVVQEYVGYPTPWSGPLLAPYGYILITPTGVNAKSKVRLHRVTDVEIKHTNTEKYPRQDDTAHI